MKDLLPTSSNDPRWAETWQELGQGAPTLGGLARVCSAAIANPPTTLSALSLEAKAILWAARKRGLLEVKGANRAYDAPGRMLAVYVDLSEDRTLILRSRDNPLVTIRFLSGFRELCAAGLVMHHIYHEFSLTMAGINAAQEVVPADVEPLLNLGTELGQFE